MPTTSANDPALSYWREGLQTALEEAGCFDALTSDQYTAAVPVIAQWADDKAMAFGEHCIPNPENAEHERQVKLLKDRIAELEEAARRTEGNFVSYFARVNGVSSSRIYVGADGHIAERR